MTNQDKCVIQKLYRPISSAQLILVIIRTPVVESKPGNPSLGLKLLLEWFAVTELHRRRNQSMADNIGMKSVSTAIVEAIAEKEEVDPTTLPPLADVIDTEALNDLFAKSCREPSASQVHATFQYYGYEVTVKSGGDITLRPVDEGLE